MTTALAVMSGSRSSFAKIEMPGVMDPGAEAGTTEEISYSTFANLSSSA
jgi:hypothetical protein